MSTQKPASEYIWQLFHNNQNLEATSMAFNKYMVVHPYSGLLSGNKEKKELSIHKKIWMNLTNVYLHERRQFKKATLDDFDYVAFWKRQKLVTVKIKISGYQRCEEKGREGWTGEAQVIFWWRGRRAGRWNNSVWNCHVDAWYHVFIKTQWFYSTKWILIFANFLKNHLESLVTVGWKAECHKTIQL